MITLWNQAGCNIYELPVDLKSFFNRSTIAAIAQDFQTAYSPFERAAFVAECLRGLDRLELMDRGWHIAEALRRHLPEPFPQAAAILVRALPPDTAPRNDTGDSMHTFRYLPHALYVSRYGLDHFEEAMQAQYELTKRFTAEFSIRPFFEKYPDATLARFAEWAKDPNVHVRRLVSEGSRPRLPWAARLRAFQRDPAPVLALLELLKDDPETYVRRSVANNLNDIAKDHPGLAIATCRRWMAEDAARLDIVRHALRSLVKQCHPDALQVLGFAAAPKVRIQNASFSPKRPKLGGTLRFSFDLVSTSRRAQELLVDYSVHFVKANGRPAPKVFKLASVSLPPRGVVPLRASVSFGELSTRKHCAGKHKVEVLINGTTLPLGSVEVTGA